MERGLCMFGGSVSASDYMSIFAVTMPLQRHYEKWLYICIWTVQILWHKPRFDDVLSYCTNCTIWNQSCLHYQSALSLCRGCVLPENSRHRKTTLPIPPSWLADDVAGVLWLANVCNIILLCRRHYTKWHPRERCVCEFPVCVICINGGPAIYYPGHVWRAIQKDIKSLIVYVIGYAKWERSKWSGPLSDLCVVWTI